MYFLLICLYSILVAEFQFSQSVYHIFEDTEEACVCLELVKGILVDDVFIEVSAETNEKENVGCELTELFQVYYIICYFLRSWECKGS